jgi:hypothetical protein
MLRQHRPSTRLAVRVASITAHVYNTNREGVQIS